MKIVETPMSFWVKAILGFIALNAFIGAGSLILFPTRTEALFFWRITPPLAATMFGGLYLCGAIAVTHAVLRRHWETARYLIPVLVCAGILLTITTLLHLDRFTPGIRLGYWLLVYVGAPLLALGIAWQYERRQGASWAVLGQPTTPLTRALAVITANLLTIFGMVSLLQPGLIIDIWPWPIAPLMVRVFASWFMAFAPGLFLFIWERDWNRLFPMASLMIGTAGIDLLATLMYRDNLSGSSLQIGLFCAHLTGFGLIGAAMHWSQRRAVLHAAAQTTIPQTL